MTKARPNTQPPADHGQGQGVLLLTSQAFIDLDNLVTSLLNAGSRADLAAKQAPIDWPAIDRIYDDTEETA